jgi:formate dehydrogenase major subunit
MNGNINRTIKVSIDGRAVYGYPGQTVLELCGEAGIEIPTLCYEPRLSTYGGCSVCLVEIEGARALIRACANVIAPGMAIRTDTGRVLSARRLALELMLSDHVGDCRPPCNLACPAQGKVQSYVNLTAQGKYREALDELRDHIPLPAAIGRVCPAPCQKKCRRNFVDETVSIREIKRFVADWGLKEGLGDVPKVLENGKRIAVVGAGPAGLSFAYFARRMGYGVTLHEREKNLGGMMRYGIPDYRLPPSVIDAEAQWILFHGVSVKTETALGRDVQLGELRSRHDAVVLAMGCWKSSAMRVKGEDMPGVMGGVDFLYTVNTHDPRAAFGGGTLSAPVELGRRVAVVGGGNTAMDACRSARRLGAEKVCVVYRRTREEMPAEDIEIREALEEGVEFIYLAAPKAVEGNGRAERLVCERMALGEPDASGRRSPVPTGEEFVLEADSVIAAIGQGVNFADVPAELHDGRRMKVDGHYATPLPGVFSCGDQQTGAKIAIEAIGNGHGCAESVDHWLKHGTPKKTFVYDVVNPALGEKDFTHIEKIARERPEEEPAEVRLKKPEEEYSRGLTESQAVRDAKRCMECGCPDVHECKLREYAIGLEVCPEWAAGAHIPKTEAVNRYYVRNMDKCVLCGRCARVCDEIAGVHAIDFAKRGFESILSPQFYKDMEHSDCVFCGLCAQLCPVGALLERRVERLPHQDKMETVKTTCPHCALGCELVLNTDKKRTRVTRITTDLDAAGTPNRGLTCLRGRYHFRDTDENRLTEPMIGTKAADWPEAVEKLSEILKGKTAFFLSASLTDQEIAAVKSASLREGSVVAARGFDPAKVGELPASFGKADTADLAREMTLLAKAAEFGQDASAFPENLKELYALGANARGLLDAGVVTRVPEAAAAEVRAGGVDAVVFIDCAPGDFGLSEGDLEAVTSVAMTSAREGVFDLALPITAWTERTGAYSALFGGSGVKLAIRMGPLPPQGARSLRWVFAEALRKLGTEI